MIYITQVIFVKEGKEDVFHEFEDFAIPLLKAHTGKIIYRLRPTKENFIDLEEEAPYEIHFISFDSEKDFENFLQDDRRLKHKHLKDASVRSSYLVKGKKL